MLFIFTLAFSGCSIYHLNYEGTASRPYPPKSEAGEVVYLEKVDLQHTVIGHVAVNTERRHPLENIIEILKGQAAKLGGDAITDIESDATGAWKKLPAQKFIGNGYVRANYKATVVAFE